MSSDTYKYFKCIFKRQRFLKKKSVKSLKSSFENHVNPGTNLTQTILFTFYCIILILDVKILHQGFIFLEPMGLWKRQGELQMRELDQCPHHPRQQLTIQIQTRVALHLLGKFWQFTG